MWLLLYWNENLHHTGPLWKRLDTPDSHDVDVTRKRISSSRLMYAVQMDRVCKSGAVSGVTTRGRMELLSQLEDNSLFVQTEQKILLNKIPNCNELFI